MKFNPLVHQENEHGHPVYNDDGTPRLKPNWAKLAEDNMGRKFNEKIHEGSPSQPKLTEDGFIKVRRRDASRKPMGAQKRMEAFVSQYKEPGYAYYVMNDEPGRMEKFLQHDWEPVVADQGAVKLKVGRARDDDTTAYLMRKPEEWYQDDQKAKVARNKQKLVEESAPKKEDGQYTPEGFDPLR